MRILVDRFIYLELRRTRRRHAVPDEDLCLRPRDQDEKRSLQKSHTQFNTQVNKIRYIIEQVIANFKTWRIMHTDYRRPIGTFPDTISAVIGLHFYAIG